MKTPLKTMQPKRRLDDLVFETSPRWKRIRLTIIEGVAVLLFLFLLILAMNFEQVFMQ